MQWVRVVAADRQPIFLHGLVSILEREFDVVASCRDGGHCVRAIRELSPQIVLIDIAIANPDGLEILAITAQERPDTRVLLLAASVEAHEFATAAARGAYGVVPKETEPDMLVECIRRVADGRKMPSAMAPSNEPHRGQALVVRRCDSTNILTQLTKRERQIMQLVSEGLSNKQIGCRLELADGTIKVHLHNIYQKLAIHNRAALATLAVSSHDWSEYISLFP